MSDAVRRIPFDIEAYTNRVRTGSCFICGIVSRDPSFAHSIIYETQTAIVFLNKYPPLYGYTLVCPREHRIQVTGDFTVEEYLDLQRLVFQVAEAVRAAVPTERVYILSLGSQQGNQHVHWHVAPLPPGVPYDDQQLKALSADGGILDLGPQQFADLAHRIRERLVSLLGG